MDEPKTGSLQGFAPLCPMKTSSQSLCPCGLSHEVLLLAEQAFVASMIASLGVFAPHADPERERLLEWSTQITIAPQFGPVHSGPTSRTRLDSSRPHRLVYSAHLVSSNVTASLLLFAATRSCLMPGTVASEALKPMRYKFPGSTPAGHLLLLEELCPVLAVLALGDACAAIDDEAIGR